MAPQHQFHCQQAQQHLYFMQRLGAVHFTLVIITIYRRTIESVLCRWITAWYRICTASDHKTLQRILRIAEKIIRSFSPLSDIYTAHCICKATGITDESTYPSHTLFSLPPSGRRFRNIQTLTARIGNSFFPKSVKLLSLKWSVLHTHSELNSSFSYSVLHILCPAAAVDAINPQLFIVYLNLLHT